MRFLSTWEAQRRVIPAEWKGLTEAQRSLWIAVMTACISPGIPVDDADMQAQLQYIWGGEQTYHRLVSQEVIRYGSACGL